MYLKKLSLVVLALALFASCKKTNVELTTFDGKAATEWTVQVEAQQADALSIYSPVSSIALPK